MSYETARAATILIVVSFLLFSIGIAIWSHKVQSRTQAMLRQQIAEDTCEKHGVFCCEDVECRF
jgi:hypothetical protein